MTSTSVQQSSDAPASSFLETLQSASISGQEQGLPLLVSTKSTDEGAKVADEKGGTERKKSADDSSDDETVTSANVQDQIVIALAASEAIPVPAQCVLTAQGAPAQMQDSAQTATNTCVDECIANTVKTPVDKNFVASQAQVIPARYSDSEDKIQSAGFVKDMDVASQSNSSVSVLSGAADAQAELSKALSEVQTSLNSCTDVDNGTSQAEDGNAVQSNPITLPIDSSVLNTQTASLNPSVTASAGSEAAVKTLEAASSQPSIADSVVDTDTHELKADKIENAQAASVKVEATPSAKKTTTATALKSADNVENGKQTDNSIVVAHTPGQNAQSGGDSQQSSVMTGDSHKQSGAVQQDPAQEEKSFTHDLSAAAGQSVDTATVTSVEQSHVSTPKTSQPQNLTVAEPGANHPSVPEAGSQISSAKLIQSASQAEMRVGMHSNEFGNISISASSTRDTVAAQISVDHTELAKTLSAQLSDFQSKSSSVQMNVQIDMHGSGSSTSSNQSSGGQTGTTGGSANQSNSDSRQSSQVFGSRSSATSASVEQQVTAGIVAAQFGNQSANVSGRLDVSA